MDRGHQPNALGPRHDDASRVQKPESAADRLAALKARVAAAVGGAKAKGGLNTPLHPALADLSAPVKPGGASSFRPGTGQRSAQDIAKSFNKKKPLGFSATGPDGARSNPYLEPVHGPTGKLRESRQLIFNQKGKYIHQANALRRQAALEDMKKRIADQARKSGLDEDRDAEKAFALDAPPELEWWDEALIGGKDYSDIPQSLKLDTDDTIVTSLIQHPVAIEPPQEKLAPEPKPMYLTPKEQQKLRRQRRMMELKEKQAKIRLGLEPAPPPKVKKSNLMRVLGEEAVKDPTAVEARVNREIAERFDKHMQENEERKLTKEQRHEKLATNQAKDASRGIHILVFKIGSLVNGQHRYKISINATQNGLNGVCIMHPKFNLVIVEGGEHSIANYKKLMLRRIDWTETLPTREKDAAAIAAAASSAVSGPSAAAVRDWLKAEDEEGNLRDQSGNKCVLLFEGETKAQAFKKWGSKVCETDHEAREILAMRKMDNFWTQAKNTPL
ncbi:pre-mRNA processing factor 3-domain-containing protein [Lasiosphaeria miniovina]|uniref:Pre-mRNA processing factor 3-domain-containing protein n=1 Tax=Lasiosphaeria miniovina TaxID=1954250 RepID=A0AA40DNR6_9PEZI|nr:pre-mRNA processing factor 3-domain-containing protein [Lasiosphaeria miniovina]KAK0706638.1 pre-mRNA processing factor 3-domain-containing protein [Lasiosphaeria miniovina]